MVLFHAVTRKDSFVKDLQTGGKYVLVFGTYFIYCYRRYLQHGAVHGQTSPIMGYLKICCLILF